MKFLRKVASLVLIAALLGGGYLWWNGGGLLLNRLFHPAAGEEYGWNLILVNQEHYIPLDYEVELTQLSNGQQVSSRIYPSLQQMFDDARAQGLALFVREGYRTQQEQTQLLEEKQAEFQQEGYSPWKARNLAMQWVAPPGTSEHQLGLAVDINPDRNYSSGEAVYGWLAENAHLYGFIRRYPPDKTQITGVSNEPWHYRYVGQKAASEMFCLNLCLEEYIDWLEETQPAKTGVAAHHAAALVFCRHLANSDNFIFSMQSFLSILTKDCKNDRLHGKWGNGTFSP